MGKRITKANEQQFSKYLSYILRHKPEDIGLNIMEDGWIPTDKLIDAINNKDTQYEITLDKLITVVFNDNKQRYSFRSEGESKYKYIRANQGHSVKNLVMNFEEITCTSILYHGTSVENAEKIKKDGYIKSMNRQYVHLSDNIDTATKVGSRHGKPYIFIIDCEKAMQNGVKFYKSENGVYLTNDLSLSFTV